MTIEQRKISLINWIANIDDETVINQIEGYRKTSISSLPTEIVELLNIFLPPNQLKIAWNILRLKTS